jgi:hypothetical protein
VTPDDNSWIITTEVTLEADSGWQDPPVRVQVITLALDIELDSDGVHPWAEY